MAHPDEKLKAIIKNVQPHQGNIVFDIPLPTVRGVLSSPTIGLSTAQVRALSRVQWNAHLLSFVAAEVNENLRMTFTVTDEDNHKIVVVNHRRSVVDYRTRAQYTLETIRDALRALA